MKPSSNKNCKVDNSDGLNLPLVSTQKNSFSKLLTSYPLNKSVLNSNGIVIGIIVIIISLIIIG